MADKWTRKSKGDNRSGGEIAGERRRKNKKLGSVKNIEEEKKVMREATGMGR